MESSTMVIKVKYGEMLRRFSVRVNEYKKLDLDINGLRAKILDLFNFSPDTDVTLTYIDEDGDIVTLVNDDDLNDVMRQQLKFLRIDVQLKSEKNAESHDRKDGSSTPPSSARGECSFQNVRTGISEVLKSLPEPLPEFCSQILVDFASKAAVTSPVLAELAQSFIRLGNTHLNSDSQSSSVPERSTENVATKSSMAPPGAGPKAPKDDGSHQEAGPRFKSGSVTKNVGVGAPASVGLNALPTDHGASGCATGKSGGPSRPFHVHNLPDSLHVDPHSLPAPYVDSSFINECPFSGVPVASGSSMPQVVDINSGNSSSGHTEPMGTMFHKGVICDGCGARPIIGPRFKSKVKENYDLCAICFAEMGNETDYIRINRPVSFRHPRFRALSRRHPLANILRGCGKQTRLDSAFVADVTVFDGTMMAPSTPFTKVWRLRNTGGYNWPRGSQLVWTGGERFSDKVSVEVEVPAEGLPVGQEIEVAVDFTAPPFNGQFISYWRMSSPAGQMFGQRVWVLIQVDSHFDDSQALDLNLPAVAVHSGVSESPEDVEKSPAPETANVVLFSRDSSPVAKPVKPDHNPPENEKQLQFPINDVLIVGKSPTASAGEDTSVSYPIVDCHGILPCSPKAPSVSYPLIDFSEPITTAAAPPPAPSPKASPAPSEKATVDDVFKETLLKTLEDMGFKHVDLNKEVLKKTGYDLEQSVDELCGVAEWDPMLEELEDMGFGDKEMNRMLLMKNKGSMKQVVMELIYGEKA